jgi:hypothetical protein
VEGKTECPALTFPLRLPATAPPPSRRQRDTVHHQTDTSSCPRQSASHHELTAADQILKDYAAGDFFSCLLLPKPDCDDAGKPLWEVTDSQIAKAFRKRSIKVHPDKNPSEVGGPVRVDSP